MTKQEYSLYYDIIQLEFDIGNLTEHEYFHQIEALAAKFGEDYEEGL